MSAVGALADWYARPMPRITPLGVDDWRTIRDVRLRALADAPHAFTSSYERERSFDEVTWQNRAASCQWFVAFDGDETVAVAGVLASPPEEPRRCELVGMWVAPSHRRRRIADGLVRAVADWARSKGASSLRLRVLEGNDEARSAYLRMGLHLAGGTQVVRGDPERTVRLMELDLDSDSR